MTKAHRVLSLALLAGCVFSSAFAGGLQYRSGLADACGNYARPSAPATPSDAPWGGFGGRGGNPCDPNWVPLGPYGGDVDDVAMSPVDANIVLAGIAPGGSGGGTLYRSTDGGASWIRTTISRQTRPPRASCPPTRGATAKKPLCGPLRPI